MNTQHVSKDEERDLEDQILTRITRSSTAMIRKGHSALYAPSQGATPVNMQQDDERRQAISAAYCFTTTAENST